MNSYALKEVYVVTKYVKKVNIFRHWGNANPSSIKISFFSIKLFAISKTKITYFDEEGSLKC